MKTRALTALIAVVLIASCGEDDTQGPGGGNNTPPDSASYRLVNAFPSLTFSNPVGIENSGDGTGRLFVVEQAGRIMVMDSASTTTTADVFLDISGKVGCCGERGLLGLAFHPDYDRNGYFYVYYTPDSLVQLTRLSRFQRSGALNAADPGSEQIMLEILQPYGNHNGGALAFGEGTDLYIGVGDGGSGGDPQGNGQNPATPLGNVLRIDVGMNPATPPYYGIPGDNPYAGNTDGFVEEIYAIGFRNPWRITYDRATMRLWAGDVGQGNWEEVDIVENGGNYGWNCREGNSAYATPSSACDTIPLSAFTPPVWVYAHPPAPDIYRSITGGFVYRGPASPFLTGKYVYADYVTGEIWSLEWDGAGADNRLLVDAPFAISSFGVGENNELYIVNYTSGTIHRLVETPVGATP